MRLYDTTFEVGRRIYLTQYLTRFMEGFPSPKKYPKACRNLRNKAPLLMDHQYRCLGMPKLYVEMPYNESIREARK